MRRRTFLRYTAAGFVVTLYGLWPTNNPLLAQNTSGTIKVWSVEKGAFIMTERVFKTDQEWRQQLSAEQFHVTRQKGTERAFSGRYDKHDEAGTYQCICCGQDLFSSAHKFDSGTGWPSYYKPIAEENISEEEDRSWFTVRTEILCSRCDAHLGHVFADGPRPTGLRYCINSASLSFIKA